MDNLLREVWELGLDIVLPRFCFGCREWRTYLCDECAKHKINYSPTLRCAQCNRMATDGRTHTRCQSRQTIDGVWAMAQKDQMLTRMIWEAKYQGAYEVLKPLGKLLSEQLPIWLVESEVVVPIPLHTKRERKRGFNQAEILGAQLAELCEMELLNNVLVRTRESEAQALIEEKQARLENVRGVFGKGVEISKVRAKRVLLVDDVSTTGATLLNAGRVLKRNGAKEVWGVVVCR